MRQRDREVKGTGVVIRRSLVEGLHPTTNGICFSVVPSSNPRSCLVKDNWSASCQLGFFNYIAFI